MIDKDRFLKLAQAAVTPEQHGLFMQQHFRLQTRIKLEECRLCELGGRATCTGFRGKTPAFLSFISAVPLNHIEIGCLNYLLPGIGYELKDVCMIPLVACGVSESHSAYEYLCKENVEWQMSLSSSRVFVLVGAGAAHLALGDRVTSVRDSHGSWYETRSSSGFKRFMFITESLAADNQLVLQNDFNALGSLLHYAWATQMQEMYPGSTFEHGMTYEQICDVVANDVRQALLKIPAEKRTDEYMRIMTRICGGRDDAGMAARALWDNGMAVKCGVDVGDGGWWLPV